MLSEKDKMCIKKAGAYNYCYILFILPNHYNQNNGWDFLYWCIIIMNVFNNHRCHILEH